MNKVLFREFTDTLPSAWPQELDLLTRHDLYFENRLANTPELVELAHALRYQVYCLERKFLTTEQQQQGLETDEFDAHSLLGLVFHRQSGDAIGTARLIMPVKGKGEDSLPISPMLRENGLRLSDYAPIDKTVEISRFAISKSFRRRIADDPNAALLPPLSREERIRRGNLVCLSLMQFMLRHAVENGATYYTAVMEEKLLRMLASMGLHFTPLGPLVDHHGLRQPSYSYIPEMMERCKAEQRDYWDVITNAGELIEKLNRVTGRTRALAS